MPKAPGLFSTTKGWPRFWRICSATTREMMSVAPPGAYGTTIFTGLEGYLSWATAMPGTARQRTDSTSKPNRFIAFSLSAFRNDARRPTAAPRAPRSGGLNAMQAVRRILAGEEHHVAIGARLAGMNRVGRDI